MHILLCVAKRVVIYLHRTLSKFQICSIREELFSHFVLFKILFRMLCINPHNFPHHKHFSVFYLFLHNTKFIRAVFSSFFRKYAYKYNICEIILIYYPFEDNESYINLFNPANTRIGILYTFRNVA